MIFTGNLLLRPSLKTINANFILYVSTLLLNMSDFSGTRKEIILTKHLVVSWADRVLAAEEIKEAEERNKLIKEIKKILKDNKFKLIPEGEEITGKKYRLICKILGKIITFVVIDAKDFLVFKTCWGAKKWEQKYFLEVK